MSLGILRNIDAKLCTQDSVKSTFVSIIYTASFSNLQISLCYVVFIFYKDFGIQCYVP
jgi:hypothetical protein